MRKTKHEKDLELAEASAPRYGMYITGGDVKSLNKALKELNTLMTTVLHAEASEGTKQAALELVRNSVPNVSNLTISNNNISQ